jgi:hypothetical protein
MRRPSHLPAWLCVIALLGCGGTDLETAPAEEDSGVGVDVGGDTTVVDVGGTDSAVDSTGLDSTSVDSSTSDSAATDTRTDSVATDSGSIDAREASVDAADGGTCACAPSWCGCGACALKDIVCTTSPKGCPLGCASSCSLSADLCSCNGDRCVRGGDPSTPVACYTTKDCPPGFCCTGLFTPPIGHGTCTAAPSGGC